MFSLFVRRTSEYLKLLTNARQYIFVYSSVLFVCLFVCFIDPLSGNEFAIRLKLKLNCSK